MGVEGLEVRSLEEVVDDSSGELVFEFFRVAEFTILSVIFEGDFDGVVDAGEAGVSEV